MKKITSSFGQLDYLLTEDREATPRGATSLSTPLGSPVKIYPSETDKLLQDLSEKFKSLQLEQTSQRSMFEKSSEYLDNLKTKIFPEMTQKIQESKGTNLSLVESSVTKHLKSRDSELNELGKQLNELRNQISLEEKRIEREKIVLNEHFIQLESKNEESGFRVNALVQKVEERLLEIKESQQELREQITSQITSQMVALKQEQDEVKCKLSSDIDKSLKQADSALEHTRRIGIDLDIVKDEHRVLQETQDMLGSHIGSIMESNSNEWQKRTSIDHHLLQIVAEVNCRNLALYHHLVQTKTIDAKNANEIEKVVQKFLGVEIPKLHHLLLGDEFIETQDSASVPVLGVDNTGDAES